MPPSPTTTTRVAGRSPRSAARRARCPRWVLLLTGLLLLSGCRLTPTADPGPGPESTVAAFAAALSSGDSAAAAALTTDPASAAQLLSAVRSSLSPTSVSVRPAQVTRTGSTAQVTADYAWTMPGGVSWTYRGGWTMRRTGPEAQPRWSIRWSPTDIHPQLADAQTLRLHQVPAAAGQLRDRNGALLVSPVRVYSLVLQPDQVADVPATATALAAILGPVDPTVTPAAVTAGLAAATPVTGYTVTNLREGDYQRLAPRLSKIRGLSAPSQVRDLPPSRDFARTVLGQLAPTVARMTTGRPGWRVVSVDASGEDLLTLGEEPARNGPDVVLTLDTVTQMAAESVIADVPQPSVVVAIQPSTGDILAVAQNRPADALGPIALTGLYPPGSTFKIITAAASVDAGLVTPNSPVPCPGTTVLGGAHVQNFEKFDLGTVSVITAFARSCNTTFATLSSKLPGDALPRAARSYGIGVDFTIPGLTTLTGKVPFAATVAQRAENGFGQGVVLVTPFGEALMSATVAHGSMPVPRIIRGVATQVSGAGAAPSAAARAALPDLMRAVVTQGTGASLKTIGPVSYLKTGSAEYIAPDGKRHAHAWSTGYTGDLAYVVLTVGGENSSRTARLARAFVVGSLPR